MARIAILYRNLADAGTVAADGEVSTLPATFLQTPHLSQVWRTPASDTAAVVTVDLGAAATMRCVALLGSNLTAAATARVKLSNVSTAGSDVYDSTLIDPAGVDPAYGSFVHIMSGDQSARYVRLELSDSSLSYLEAGRLVVGPMWLPSYNYDRTDFERFTVDDSLREPALSGAEWIEEKPTRRGIRFALPAVSTVEVSTNLDAMATYAGRRKAVLVCLDPEADNLGQETYYGRLTNSPAVIQRGLGRYRQPFEVITTL